MEESDNDLEIDDDGEVTKITGFGFWDGKWCREGLLFPIQQLN